VIRKIQVTIKALELFMRISLKNLLTIGLLITLMLLSFGSGENPDPQRFKSEIDAFLNWDSKNAPPADPVVFVGSSSIRLWRTHTYFPDLPVINRGFGGSHISDVNYYADTLVLKFNPQIIVFYAGDNDIADGKSPETVYSDFTAFFDRIHTGLPSAKIVYLPIKPSPSRWQYWPAMQEANSRIEALCTQDPDLYYVDTASPMIGGNGRPMPGLFVSDSLHLNQTGYKLWTGILAPELRDLLKQK
jgi:lysophospholipase L1-like esterase